MGMPNLEATFETLVDAFVFLDKNKDGYVSKSEMVQAINETTSGGSSSGQIGMKRFGKLSLCTSMYMNDADRLICLICYNVYILCKRDLHH
jgi:hypothetical protein